MRTDAARATAAAAYPENSAAPERGFARDEPEGRLDIAGGLHGLALDPGDERPDGEPADVVLVGRDGGEGGVAEPALLDVVEPDDRDVLRDPQPGLDDRPHRADRDEVVVREHRIGRCGERQKLP